MEQCASRVCLGDVLELGALDSEACDLNLAGGTTSNNYWVFCSPKADPDAADSTLNGKAISIVLLSHYSP